RDDFDRIDAIVWLWCSRWTRQLVHLCDRAGDQLRHPALCPRLGSRFATSGRAVRRKRSPVATSAHATAPRPNARRPDDSRVIAVPPPVTGGLTTPLVPPLDVGRFSTAMAPQATTLDGSRSVSKWVEGR